MGRNTMRSSVNNAMRQRLFTEYLNEQKLITNDKISFKKRNKMKTVHVQIMAFDKNSNDNIGRGIVANTKESFNKQVSEFEEEVPYTKFYIEIIADEVLDEEQEKIVEDHEVN